MSSVEVDDRRCLKPLQASELLGGVALTTLARWRVTGQGPRFRKLGPGRNAPVVYMVEDLVAWLDANTFGSTSEYDKRA